MKLKISLEKEIAEWKTKAEESKIEKAANEWKLEKELLEKQLGMTKSQMEENRKLYDSLKSAIDKSVAKSEAEDSQDQVHLMEVNKVCFHLLRYKLRNRIYQLHSEELKNGRRYLSKR